MATIITLSGIVNQEFKLVKNDDAPFGFFIKIGKNLYDVDLTLHKVTFDKKCPGSYITECECFNNDDNNGDPISSFVNVQGHVIETN